MAMIELTLSNALLFVISGLLTIIGYSFNRTLSRIEVDCREMRKIYFDHEKRISKIEGTD